MGTDLIIYRYYFKQKNKIVYRGITNDIDRREIEHQRQWGQSKGHIKQIGFRTTVDKALEWEREQAKKHPDQVRSQAIQQ